MIFNYKMSYYNIKIYNIKKLKSHQLCKTYFFRPKLKLDFLPNF